MRRSTYLWLVLMSALAVPLAACGGGEDTGVPDHVSLAVYAGPEAALVYLAEAEGFFAEEGVEVAVAEYASDSVALDALLAGEADLATASSFAFVSSALERDDLRIVSSIAETDTVELVARRDREIASPQDLAGMTIGVSRQTLGEYYLGTLLATHGLALSDTAVVDLPEEEIVAALRAGSIDAGISWDPNTHAMREALGPSAVSWRAQAGQPAYFLLMARDAFTVERPEAIERVIRALVKAERKVTSDGAKAKEFVQATFGYDPTHIDASWDGRTFTVKLPQELLVVLADQARWRVRNGLTAADSVPNFLRHVYLDALDAVAPDAITVIR